MSVFGRIVTGKMVRRAVEVTLRLWVPTYLAEVSRQDGRGASLPPYLSYVPALDPDKFEEDQLPSCVIVTPGTAQMLRRREYQSYDVRWSVAVGAIVSGQDRDNTLELIELYAAANRAILVQKPSLGGFANGTEWLTERYDELDTEDLRTIGIGLVTFGVDVYGVVDSRGGLTAPPADPTADPGEWPTVETVDVSTERKE